MFPFRPLGSITNCENALCTFSCLCGPIPVLVNPAAQLILAGGWQALQVFHLFPGQLWSSQRQTIDLHTHTQEQKHVNQLTQCTGSFSPTHTTVYIEIFLHSDQHCAHPVSVASGVVSSKQIKHSVHTHSTAA